MLESKNYKSRLINQEKAVKFIVEQRQPPKLIQDWEKEYQKKLKLYEFRTIMRGGLINQKEVDELLAMMYHKDYLYGKWIEEDDWNEDLERQKLKDLGYFKE